MFFVRIIAQQSHIGAITSNSSVSVAGGFTYTIPIKLDNSINESTPSISQLITVKQVMAF